MERNENAPNLQEPEGAQLNRNPVVDPEDELEDDDDRQDPPDPTEVQAGSHAELAFGESLGQDMGLNESNAVVSDGSEGTSLLQQRMRLEDVFDVTRRPRPSNVQEEDEMPDLEDDLDDDLENDFENLEVPNMSARKAVTATRQRRTCGDFVRAGIRQSLGNEKRKNKDLEKAE